MKNYKGKLLLVEDDQNLGFILKDYLEMLNYFVDWQKNGVTGYTAFSKGDFDLCILDVMLPLKDGFTLAEEIRKADEFIPVLFLTAKTMKEDRIRGFRIGADDYVTKPFSTEELSLRIEAILKRYRNAFKISDKQPSIKLGKFTFDHVNQILITPTEEIHLTKREADVLRLLCLNVDTVLRREVALKNIWGDDDYFKGRSMDVYIAKLRKYLKEDKSVSITNVHGTGFKLEILNEKS
ncbi:MAG: two-component system response regulator [Bacteroidetes bacterium GWF2_38_335]|nr:MAG: two-component system response regulator [Bacteroidetes bacterium GWF2_38_335]OFY79473.1 MAG: two-component system response regulator [Bacteroidetes bacterium RIFOXYA12_FULL_38_20]HBS86591.1 DNA-binding response regulator [Bacteroidales bacterium]